MQVNAVASAKHSPSGMRVAMKDVPKIEFELNAELMHTTR